MTRRREPRGPTGALTPRCARRARLCPAASLICSASQALPAEVKRRLRALKNLNTQHGELEAQFRADKLALERRYEALYAPLYARRREIVTGAAEPTDAECERELSDVEDGVQQASIQELDAEGNPPAATKGACEGLPM
jgi:hypothetical protein